jgi:serine protease Do
LEFNGAKIDEMKELPIIVAQTEVGKTVDVKIWRNKKEIIKKIKLGRLETSEDFKEEKKEVAPDVPEASEIKSLKIIARLLNKKDIEQRKLPNQTTGLVITNIGKNSPVNYLNVGDVIVEAQKKKIKSIKDLEKIVSTALKSNQKTILIVIYNSQNQRRYIGVKLD